MAEKEKKDSSALLTTVVVILLCLFFVVGFAWGLSKVIAMEGAYPPEKVVQTLTPEPTDNAALVSHIDSLLEKVTAEKPKAKKTVSYSVKGFDSETGLSDQMLDTLGYIKGEFENTLKANFYKALPTELAFGVTYQCGECEEFFPAYFDKCEKCGAEGSCRTDCSSDFFEPCDSYVLLPELGAKDIASFEYIYYECGNCGARTDHAFDRCEKCNVPDECRSYADIHNVTVELKNNETICKNVYFPLTNEQALILTGGKLDDVLTIDRLDFTTDALHIGYKADRPTDRLTRLDYTREILVTAEVTFKGDFAALGAQQLRFTLTRTDSLEFTWPALVLSAHEMTVEPKKSDNLLATLICDDPLAYTVTWSSSDESILTVDEEGYFKAGKKTGKAVITASYEFGGQTCSDECEVEVKIPVESLKMSKRKLSLSVGETAKLKVSFSPKKATIQTLQWYTEDESIATVDENGTVTAVGAGTVTVYALSDDGYFKSSSEVTVQ